MVLILYFLLSLQLAVVVVLLKVALLAQMVAQVVEVVEVVLVELEQLDKVTMEEILTRKQMLAVAVARMR
jgi:hypothetical protein